MKEPIGSTDHVPCENKIAICKFFTPDSNWTWYACEFDPVERIFFGFVRGMENEWGYFSLDELESVRAPLGLPIERDQVISPYLTDG